MGKENQMQRENKKTGEQGFCYSGASYRKNNKKSCYSAEQSSRGLFKPTMIHH